jgi:phosphoesterase RecJ-like protein
MKIDAYEAADFFREHDNYLILMHASPDGDTLGSGHALCGILQRMGKNAKAVCPEAIPHRFDYMYRAVKKQDFEPQTIVCVDVADTKLLGDMKEIGDKAELCIDHHLSNTGYAKRELIHPEYAAAAEVVYDIICALGEEIDTEIANCIYTGIATDTGCFRFSNTTPQSHMIAAVMIKCGAEIAPINYAMFDMKTQGRITLEREVLQNIRYYENGHVALISIPLALLDKIDGIDTDDVGAMAALPRQIEGVDIGICLKEKKPGVYKASMRSSERINVADVCMQFGGGGHARAAGCSFTGTYEDAEKAIVTASCEAIRNAGIS